MIKYICFLAIFYLYCSPISTFEFNETILEEFKREYPECWSRLVGPSIICATKTATIARTFLTFHQKIHNEYEEVSNKTSCCAKMNFINCLRKSFFTEAACTTAQATLARALLFMDTKFRAGCDPNYQCDNGVKLTLTKLKIIFSIIFVLGTTYTLSVQSF